VKLQEEPSIVAVGRLESIWADIAYFMGDPKYIVSDKQTCGI